MPGKLCSGNCLKKRYAKPGRSMPRMSSPRQFCDLVRTMADKIRSIRKNRKKSDVVPFGPARATERLRSGRSFMYRSRLDLSEFHMIAQSDKKAKLPHHDSVSKVIRKGRQKKTFNEYGHERAIKRRDLVSINFLRRSLEMNVREFLQRKYGGD